MGNSPVEFSVGDIEKTIRGITIPSPPQILSDLHAVLSSPGASISDVVDVISKDAGVSGMALRTVNSPIFGISNPVESIDRAVFVLGSSAVMNIVNCVCLRNEMMASTNIPGKTKALLSKLWDCQMDMAIACSVVSSKLGVCATDKAYMVGLFHNVGAYLLLSKHENYPSVLVEKYRSPCGTLVAAENAAYDTNYAVIGYYVARAWRLPESVCSAIVSQHNFLHLLGAGGCKDDGVCQMIAVLKIAEHLIGMHRVLGNTDDDFEWARVGDAVMEYLGITDIDVNDIADELAERGIGQRGYFVG